MITSPVAGRLTDMVARRHIAGVYFIEHIETQRLYVGSSADISSRWAAHKRDLRSGKHVNRHLRFAWEKYGAEAFRFGVIEECHRADLIELEQEYIDALHPYFNIAQKAGTPPPPSAEFIAAQRARAAAITHCPAGHDYTEANTGLNTQGKRYCRKCAAEWVAARIAAETPEQRELRRNRVTSYYERNRDKINTQSCAHQAEHKDEKREYDLARRIAQKAARPAPVPPTDDELTAKAEARRAKLLANKARYYARHREREMAKMKAYYHSHK